MDLGDSDVEVVIVFTGSGLRMTQGESEIGDWDGSAYTLSRAGEGSFRLHVEGDELVFRPAAPREFAIAASVARARSGSDDAGSLDPQPHAVAIGPPPGALTLLLFYLLVAATIAMGIWAGLSLASP